LAATAQALKRQHAEGLLQENANFFNPGETNALGGQGSKEVTHALPGM